MCGVYVPQRRPELRGRMKKPPPSRDVPGGRILPREPTPRSVGDLIIPEIPQLGSGAGVGFPLPEKEISPGLKKQNSLKGTPAG